MNTFTKSLWENFAINGREWRRERGSLRGQITKMRNTALEVGIEHAKTLSEKKAEHARWRMERNLKHEEAIIGKDMVIERLNAKITNLNEDVVAKAVGTKAAEEMFRNQGAMGVYSDVVPRITHKPTDYVEPRPATGYPPGKSGQQF